MSDTQTKTAEMNTQRFAFLMERIGCEVSELDSLNGRGGLGFVVGPNGPAATIVTVQDAIKYNILIPRFLLVERDNSRNNVWFSLHTKPADAANYHDGQEYVEDWGEYRLHDLDTGKEFYPEITTTWHPEDLQFS